MLPPTFRAIRLGILLVSIGLVLGQDASGRFDVLHGNLGESSCTLQDNIIGNCKPLKRRDSSSSILERDTTSPVPSSCTCNTIFFNIWSACSYSTGNTTLPNFTNWKQACTNDSINIDSSTAFSKGPGNLAIDIPSWAVLAVPGNTSFDIQKAVTLTYSPRVRWTPIQIILPVAVLVITLFISGVLLLIYKGMLKSTRCRSRLEWPKGLKPLQLRPSHKVTASFDRTDDWEIDQDDDAPMKLVKFAPSIQESVFSGRPVRAPHVDLQPADVYEFDENSKPVLNSNSKTEKPLMGTHSFRMPTRLVRLPVPWKRRPPQIKLVPATHRFRVDDVSKSVCGTNTEEGENGFGQMAKSDEAADDDVYPYLPQDEEEATNLITPTEREERNFDNVLIISKEGQPFTFESNTNTLSISSHIKVESPSVSSASPRSTLHKIPSKPVLHIPIPPPPSHAAPIPPITPRGTTERPSGEATLANFLPRSFLSPIREVSPSNSYSSSNTSLRRSPALARRPSNPESNSTHRSIPNPSQPTQLPPDYSDLHRTSFQNSELSLALDVESEEAFYDPYLDFTPPDSRYYHGISADDDWDASCFYTSPQPVRAMSPNPNAFFPGPVRGAGYPRTYVQQSNPF